jgi:hypothetical protein
MTAEAVAVPGRHRAQCACGQLVVLCEGEPVKVSVCHCLDCQRRTGSPFGVAAFFPRAAVAVSGECRTYLRPSDTGHEVLHHFCPHCGSTVFWKPSRLPDLVALGTGAFADPSFAPPTQQVYTRSRHGWIELNLPVR